MPPKNPRYCPICGETLGKRQEGGRLRPACDSCGYIHFLNPVPGVGMLIEQEGGIVLIKRRNPPHQHQWTLPSGFVEADESAEEAAIREAYEETGLIVEIIELANINSFPEGPPVSGIMIFYRMRPIGGNLQAGDDALDVRVFAPDDLPVLPFRTHREIIAEWRERFAPTIGTTTQQPPSSEILIRPATAIDADSEAVLSLLMTIPNLRQLDDGQKLAIVQRLQEQDHIEVYLAEAQSIVIGFVSLTIIRDLTRSIGLISTMAVSNGYRRRGVGAELLEAVMRRASQLNLQTLWVDQRNANDQARAFYAALGFEALPILRLKL